MQEAGLRAAKDFEQCGGDGLSYCGGDRPKSSHEAFAINGTNLIQRYLSSFSLEANRYPGRVGTFSCSHRCDDQRLQITIHFIGRDNQARPDLPNLCSLCRIEIYHPDLVPTRTSAYQFHSLRSKSLACNGSSNASSCTDGPAARNSSSHPARGRRAEEIMRQSFCTRSSTLFPSLHSSMMGFGIRTPRELPILISSVCMGM